MQRQIEALLAAFLADRDKEAEMVQGLLTALAVGSAGRQRMMQELAAAVGAEQPASPILDRASSPRLSAEITAAIVQLRAAQSATTH